MTEKEIREEIRATLADKPVDYERVRRLADQAERAREREAAEREAARAAALAAADAEISKGNVPFSALRCAYEEAAQIRYFDKTKSFGEAWSEAVYPAVRDYIARRGAVSYQGTYRLGPFTRDRRP